MYLIYPDVDNLILDQITDPPTILALSEVNKYCLAKVSHRRTELNLIQYDFTRSCMKISNVWIAQWILQTNNKIGLLSNREKLSKKMFNVGFQIACIQSNVPLIKWILDTRILCNKLLIHKCFCQKLCQTVRRNEHIQKIPLNIYCDGYNRKMRCCMLKLLFAINAHTVLNVLLNSNIILEPVLYQDKGEFSVMFYNACLNKNIELLEILMRYDSAHEQNICIEEVFINLCKSYDLEIVQAFANNSKKYYGQNNLIPQLSRAFENCCRDNKIKIARCLIKYSQQNNHEIDIHANEEKPFRYAFLNNNIAMAKWLIRLGERSHGRINIHAKDEKPFRYACKNGNVAMAKWLIRLGKKSYGRININIRNNEALLLAIKSNSREIANIIENTSKQYGTSIDYFDMIRSNQSDTCIIS